MRLYYTFLSSWLLVSVALANPLIIHRRGRYETRRLSHLNNLESHLPYTCDTDQRLFLNRSDERYTSNWAGAVLTGTDYNFVTAEITVPTPKPPSQGPSLDEYCASAWVGIDGDTCSTAILQTGIEFCVRGNSISYDAWFEWYPAYSHSFSHRDISLSAGDRIKMTVNATSKISGTAVIENISTGQIASHAFSGPFEVHADLCGYNAEWIVEDFIESTVLVPFVDFEQVIFSKVLASRNGTLGGPVGSTLVDIKQKGIVLTSSSVTSDSVIVKHL
ncbi:hypothetical protein VI817_004776 [Penicillium citrinum]|uniref:Aspergillopepsin-2 n=1 Tax=Penicillium hetheringtonii TaxID=911720 RepID=A0AAD6GX77_9EURO|nr:hypothetical protein N7450_002341 [Penicillium hetheringtonii]KAK5798486.1 hypothetical protein VI817_004776 [Penicillium citrinum]